MVIKIILYVIVVLLSIPVGLWIAWLARDELVKGRKWFKIVIVLSIVSGIAFAFLGKYNEMLALVVLVIISAVAYLKSFDKKWVVAWGRA